MLVEESAGLCDEIEYLVELETEDDRNEALDTEVDPKLVDEDGCDPEPDVWVDDEVPPGRDDKLTVTDCDIEPGDVEVGSLDET